MSNDHLGENKFESLLMTALGCRFCYKTCLMRLYCHRLHFAAESKSANKFTSLHKTHNDQKINGMNYYLFEVVDTNGNVSVPLFY